jgi:hypothetical protein
MLATLVGFAISWYFGLAPLFAVCAAISFFFPRFFRFLFWLFTLPFLLTLGASLLTIIAWGYDLAPFDSTTWHTCLYISLLPSLLLTNYLSGDLN